MTRGVTVFRTAVFLVWVVPWISVAILWGWLFDANYGLINAILQNLGMISAPVNFLADPWLARMMLVVGLRLAPDAVHDDHLDRGAARRAARDARGGEHRRRGLLADSSSRSCCRWCGPTLVTVGGARHASA